MCLRIGACFGVGPDDHVIDYGIKEVPHHTTTTTTKTFHPPPPPPVQRGGYHGLAQQHHQGVHRGDGNHGHGHAHHQQQGFHHGNGYHGHAQQQQGFHNGKVHWASDHQTAADEAGRKASKDTKGGPAPAPARGGHGYPSTHPARNATVGGDAGHGAHYFHEPADRDDTTDHHYQTTATTDHERY